MASIEARGQRVAGEVVDAPERQAAAGGEALGEHHAGEDAADQARAGGDGDGVEVGEADAGGGEGGDGDGVEALGVGAGGDLGDDAAVGVVQRVLADDLGGEDLADRLAGAGANHRDGGVVAAALDAEDDALVPHACLSDCAGRARQVTPRRARRNGAPRSSGDGARMAEPRTLLLTRPRAQSEAFAAMLEARLPGRFRVVVAPLIAIAPVAGALDLAGVQGLLFTSANGVEQFVARSGERGLPAFCVGAMTAAAARRAGFAARSADGDVAALAALVAAAARPGAGEFLHVRGRHAAGDLIGRLAAAGVPARAAEIYDAGALPLPAAARALLAAGGPRCWPSSRRGAPGFRRGGGGAGWDLGAAIAVSLSAATDAALGGLAAGRAGDRGGADARGDAGGAGAGSERSRAIGLLRQNASPSIGCCAARRSEGRASMPNRKSDATQERLPEARGRRGAAAAGAESEPVEAVGRWSRSRRPRR